MFISPKNNKICCTIIWQVRVYLQKTKPFYPNIYLGLGIEFEFGPQIIRDLAIVCPYSVDLPIHHATTTSVL